MLSLFGQQRSLDIAAQIDENRRISEGRTMEAMVAEQEQQALTSIEKFCIGVLAVVTGIIVAAIICNTVLNLVLYHRFTAPSAEDANLAGGFVLLALVPIFLLTIIVSITGVFYLFRKLK